MEYKKWLLYWKKNLIDSLKADIEIDKLEYFELENFKIEDQIITKFEEINKLIDLEEIRINKKKGIANKENESWVSLNELQVIISPLKIKPTVENLALLKDKKPKLPFWFFAKLNRNGELQVPYETTPLFQRKYLEPLADENTEFIFSSVETVDKNIAVKKEEYKTYLEYIRHLKYIFTAVTTQEIEQYSALGHETRYNAIILLPNEDINVAIGIIQLYEKILNEQNLPSLLKKLITLKNENVKDPVGVSDLINANTLHVGQMGFDFPLSISQRKSLYTYLQTNEQIFAVNGPPGTGKTTLLQSIVANKFVESAIIGKNAPIILACSSNNQAVTNIIDSFSKSNTKIDRLQGRWLPGIAGYATYLPSNNKTEAELKGINYKKQNGEGVFSQLESHDFLQKAKKEFTEKCEKYFGTPVLNIKDVTKKLQKEIIQLQSILKDASSKWEEYVVFEKKILTNYLTSNSQIKQYYKNNILDKTHFKNDINTLKNIEKEIIYYFNNEAFFRTLFCFFGLKSALRNRASEVKIIIRDSLIEYPDKLPLIKTNILQKTDAKIKMAIEIIEKIEDWEHWKTQNSISGNPPKTEEEYWEFELLKTKENSKPNCFYDELDVTFRHKAFQLAIHYWESRYLTKLEEDLKLDERTFKSNGLEPVKNRWQRQAMLTPCFVSTFYMAPKFFSSFRFLKTGEDGKSIFNSPPLFDFIDLLIVDEAGQVSPEVGVAAFSLAKQAIIVGDVKQIEPVWNISKKIDIGNLRKCGLINNYDDLNYEREFDPKGFLSSTGSLMRMAQNACNFKENGITEKGVMLVEHRRCYNEIIEYCNVLAYNGKLIPLKGKAKSDLLFPPMYCIHVEGSSSILNASRYNQNEVVAIVSWLLKNRLNIENKYGQLEKTVGIITPFATQKNRLKEALKGAGFDVDLLKVGTVHALQGAERAIILFSMVYGKGDSETMFFDRENKPNMLNVAVSRAKDNFIVFANTNVLNKKAKTPSGILSNYLSYEIITNN